MLQPNLRSSIFNSTHPLICTSLICLSLSLSVNGNFKEPMLNFNPRNNQGEMSVRSKAVRELKVFTVALVYSEIFSTSSRPKRPGFQTDYFR
jgi:hypothetical protein